MIALLAAAATLTAPGLLNDNWPPVRFEGDRRGITLNLVSQAEIYAICGRPPRNLARHGCSNKTGNWITLLNPCRARGDDDVARDLCHELGHLNSWPAGHPR